MHLAQTTITYVALSPKKIFQIEAFFIHLNSYWILPLQTHKKINIHSCFFLQITKSLSIKIFLAYQGYDTLILVPRFQHLVSLAYQGYATLIRAPWFLHLVFSYISRLQHLDPRTKVSTPCFSCLSRGFYTLLRFFVFSSLS